MTYRPWIGNSEHRPDSRDSVFRGTALRSVLVIGPGPVAMGRDAGFDSLTVQACRVLREEGLRVVVIDPAPSAVVTDPGVADAAYLEPLDADTVRRIIAKEHPDALLPTVGGQAALDLTALLAERGVLTEYDVELIGLDVVVLERARSVVCRRVASSPATERRIYEVEVLRDRHGGELAVCVIETIDLMGTDESSSITTAPAMTLTEQEHRTLCGVGLAITREIGLHSGVCGVQCVLDPITGGVVVIGITPRLSHSSLLASEATGFSIAEIATRLALGGRLDELGPPPEDRVVVKASMKPVGETMAVGGTFIEALQKAVMSSKGGIAAAMDAFGAGEKLHDDTKIDPWFLSRLLLLQETAHNVAKAERLSPQLLLHAKQQGLTDAQLGGLRRLSEDVVRSLRHELGVCRTEVLPRSRPAVIVLGPGFGLSRTGLGTDLVHSCVQACIAVRDAGFEAIIVDDDPAAAATYRDSSDHLYPVPLTVEDVLDIVATGPVAPC